MAKMNWRRVDWEHRSSNNLWSRRGRRPVDHRLPREAKFEGRCGRCGGPIAKGSRIHWAPGQPAYHFVCPLDLDQWRHQRELARTEEFWEGFDV